MSKPNTSFPTEVRNVEVIGKRVKRDLVWMLLSVAVALAAAAATYMLL